MKNIGKGLHANHLQSHTTGKIKTGRKGAQSGQWGLEKDPTLSYWTINSTFVK